MNGRSSKITKKMGRGMSNKRRNKKKGVRKRNESRRKRKNGGRVKRITIV